MILIHFYYAEERTLKECIVNSKKFSKKLGKSFENAKHYHIAVSFVDVDVILIALKKIKFDMKTTFDLAEKLDLNQEWYDDNQEKYKEEPFENILKEFLSRWLEGDGKTPKTYETLCTALKNLTNRYDALLEETFPASI